MEDKAFSRKVLVPVDGSDSSLLAEETAALVAKKTGAAVTVLHVIREVEEYYRLLYATQGLEHDIPDGVIKEILNLTEQEANKIVNDARTLFNKEGVTIDTKILRGIDPADSILEFSKKDYGLIVMGARGKNEKDPYALGSVTKKVIRHTTCPTLFVKKTCSLSNLLVCIDGSEHSIKALDYTVKLAEKMGSKITLLNVQERRFHDLSPYARSVSEKLSERILSKALSAIGKEGLKVDRKVEFGVASDRIVEVAEKGNHDLIVLGSRGLGTVKRFLLGSISDDVSHKAKRSVLIFPIKHE
jgi:nucleotide-binding universal stress UspA family protein